MHNQWTSDTLLTAYRAAQRDFRWANLALGRDLTRANLGGANLTGANLGGADLTGANLGGETDLSLRRTSPRANHHRGAPPRGGPRRGEPRRGGPASGADLTRAEPRPRADLRRGEPPRGGPRPGRTSPASETSAGRTSASANLGGAKPHRRRHRDASAHLPTVTRCSHWSAMAG